MTSLIPRVLIAGEFSGKVRDAFRRRGYDAVSCDYRSSEQPGPHYQGSWFDIEIQRQRWDLMIAHPDCTFLVVSGAKWMAIEWREEAQLAALHTVKALYRMPRQTDRDREPGWEIVIALARAGSDYSAVPVRGSVQEDDLSVAEEPAVVGADQRSWGDGEQACWKEPPGPERKKNRARTYPGIAEAMAEQWGATLQGADSVGGCDG